MDFPANQGGNLRLGVSFIGGLCLAETPKNNLPALLASGQQVIASRILNLDEALVFAVRL